jgi:hypothetical protein
MSKKFLVPAIIALTLTAAASAATADSSESKKNSAAGGQRSDFALFDGTNASDPDAGVSCGARISGENGNGNGNSSAIAFTYSVAVSNFSNDVAFLRITYADGDLVRFAVPANSSFSLNQSAGGTKGVDDRIKVTSETAGALAGAVSIMVPSAAKPPAGQSSFCVTLKP